MRIRNTHDFIPHIQVLALQICQWNSISAQWLVVRISVPNQKLLVDGTSRKFDFRPHTEIYPRDRASAFVAKRAEEVGGGVVFRVSRFGKPGYLRVLHGMEVEYQAAGHFAALRALTGIRLNRHTYQLSELWWGTNRPLVSSRGRLQSQLDSELRRNCSPLLCFWAFLWTCRLALILINGLFDKSQAQEESEARCSLGYLYAIFYDEKVTECRVLRQSFPRLVLHYLKWQKIRIFSLEHALYSCQASVQECTSLVRGHFVVKGLYFSSSIALRSVLD